MTNKEKILQMSDDDLALVLMCPYDTSGNPEDIMPCISEENKTGEFVSPKYCHACLVDWLGKEAK